MKKILKQSYAQAHTVTRSLYKRVTRTIITYPAYAFFGVLGVLFLSILVGSVLSKPKTKTEKKSVSPKVVSVYNVGTAPRVTMTAQVETSGVVKIIAQTSGVVQQVYVTEGAQVHRGTALMWLSTNYQGGTLPSVTRQIAQKNYEFVNSTYDAQKDLIVRQREIADSVQKQAGDTRNITNNSISDTKNLLTLNQQIVDSLVSQIAYLESTNVGGANDSLILQSKQGQSGAQSAINSLRVAVANAEYQVGSDNAPTQLSNKQHDLTIAQLAIQEKSLDLNRELAKLNLGVAQISESLMFPASPFAGTVERVNVTPGMNVSSGTVLATITGVKKTSSIVLLVPEATAKNISRIEPSTVTVGMEYLDLLPRYISTQPTDGALYSVVFSVPSEKESLFASGSTVSVQVSLGAKASMSAVPFVPIDALYQTATESYVYVATPSGTGAYVVKSIPVKLGQVFGQYVEVLSGLSKESHIITSRAVVSDESVNIE